MDFAPEPVLDAFTPPPTRAAPRAPEADDNGQTFGDHLDAVTEPAERPAPAQQQTDTKDDTQRVEAKASTGDDEPASDHDEAIDPDVALLGGPLPAAPAPMAAPVVVQIVASQTEPPQPQAQPQDADLAAAPVSAPQAPAPAEPAQDAAAAQPVDQGAPHADKRDAATDASAQQQPQQSAPQTQTAQAPVTIPQIPIAQTAPTTIEQLPEVLQQAIAATTAPAAQAAAQPAATPRVSKDAKQQVDAKTASAEGEPKIEAGANVKAQAPKASHEGVAKADAAPVFQPQTSAPDTSPITQTNTIATTTSQASTHVQHAAVDASAQRTAPVAAQVGREIVRRFSGGATSFELRLDPADLGRVEVRMEVTRDNRVTAVITADNPQALTELARNARDLEQQLQSAGLQLTDNGLSFDLRQGAQGGENNGEQASSNARGDANAASAQQEQQTAPVARPIGYERWRGVRVDMMV